MMIRLYTFKPCIALLATVLLNACTPEPPTSKAATPAEIRETILAKKNLTLVHVWATWCAPCVEEFPELVHIMNEYPELHVLLISGDEPDELENVNAFLAEHHSPLGSLVATALNSEFIEALSPQWAGSLPASFFYIDGKLVEGWEGKRTFREYKETIERLLKNKRSSTS
jgi:thiol-disulfide isomerase/thioredoxin